LKDEAAQSLNMSTIERWITFGCLTPILVGENNRLVPTRVCQMFLSDWEGFFPGGSDAAAGCSITMTQSFMTLARFPFGAVDS
jgi:hypothetical protein